MLRIAALNDSSNSQDDQIQAELTKTKEAKEAEAFAAYNKALSYQHKGNTPHAEKLLRNLFDHPLLKEAAGLVADDTQVQNKSHSGLQLLYSIHKNLASILLQRNELREAMAAYIEAVKIDSTEVTVWFQMGQVARKLNNYPLAKICFQQALECNPNHWPTLDNAITVTYALGDYLLCLQNISLALERDCNYPKGLALRKQIYFEQPSLKKLTKEFFTYCNSSINTTEIDKEDKQEYLDEVAKIRSTRRLLAAEENENEMKPITFLKPLTPFSWKNVGEQLIDLYDFVTSSIPPKSLAMEVDLRDYFFLDQSVFLHQYDELSRVEVDSSKQTKGPSEAVTQKTQEVSALKAALSNAKVKEPISLIQSVSSTKETALLKRLQGTEDVVGPAVAKKSRTDAVQGSEDLDVLDAAGDTFEIPLLREVDMDIDALNLVDIQKSELKPELLLKDDEIATNDIRSLENVLASVIDMEFEVQNEHGLEKHVSVTKTVQDLELSLQNTSVTTTGKDMFQMEQSENLENLVSADGDMLTLSLPSQSSFASRNERNNLEQKAVALESIETNLLRNDTKSSPQQMSEYSVCSVQLDNLSEAQSSSPIFELSQMSSMNVCDPSLSFNTTAGPRSDNICRISLEEHNLESAPTIPDSKAPSNQFNLSLSINTNDALQQISPDYLSVCNKSPSAVDKLPDVSFTESMSANRLVSVTSKSNLYPTELSHSPITTSLLSPNSSACPKSASVYHNFLCSLNQNESMTVDKNQQIPTLHKSTKTACPKSPNRHEHSNVEKDSDAPENVSSELSRNEKSQMFPAHVRHDDAHVGGVRPAASLSLPQLHLNMLTALESEMLLKSSRDSHKPAVTEWTRKRLSRRHSDSRPPSLFQSPYSPRDYYGHSSPKPTGPASQPHLNLSPSAMSSWLSQGYPWSFGTGQSLLSPLATSPPRMFPRSAFPQYQHSYQDEIVGLQGLSPFSLGLLSPNQQFSSLNNPPLNPLSNPAQLLKDAAAHYESIKASMSLPLYHDVISHKSSSGHSNQYHQQSPKSPSHFSDHHDLSTWTRHNHTASSHLQGLARISQPPPSSTTNVVSYQTGDHSYQKKGLVFKVMMDCNQSCISGTSSTLGQSMASKELSATHDTSSRAIIRHGAKSSSGVKRGAKRKIEDAYLEELKNAYKRRSTRRSQTKNQKEGKSVNYKDLMKSFFPPSLLKVGMEDNPDRAEEFATEVDNCEQEINLSNKPIKKLSENEEEDVKQLIRSCLKCNGVMDLIYKYLLQLANKSDHVWYDGIADIYLKLYKRLRKHFSVPTVFDSSDVISLEGLRNYAAVILVWCELNLNQAVVESGLKNLMSPSKLSQHSQSFLKLLGEFRLDDMTFLSSLIGRNDALGTWLGHFSVRFYWLKAKEHQFLNETLDAVDCYEIAQEFLQDVERECTTRDQVNTGVIILPNLQDKLISSNEARRQLEALQRCKSLEDTQKLYEETQYDRVVENLIATFTNKTSKRAKSLAEKERPSQLLLLVNSLYHLNKHVEGIHWAEVSLNEAVLYYKRVPSLHLHQEWAATLVSLFSCIDRLLEEDNNLLSSLSRSSLYRLADNLASVIDICLDVAETVKEMPIATLLPWKILYKILRYEELSEEKIQRNSEKDNEMKEDDEDEEEMSRSLTMLTEAHEHLGRHSWCTRDNGSLLIFTMSIVEKDLEEKDDIHFEQCVYCLYGHPNKKGKARHLSDHNVEPVSLTWEKAGVLYYYYAPQQIPEFDSYKIKSVTSDVENLFRRIYALVPNDLNPAKHLSAITDYIDGTTDFAPTAPLITVQHSRDPYKMCQQLYYLLGDFYFKNKEPTKAVKFYQLDLVINSNRLDSWAGLALAKMYQIEQKLNSTDLKIETAMYKKSRAAVRCFSRAVELQKGSRKLWLEFGSLAYQLHSHASRQIRYKDLLSISHDIIENSKLHQEKALAQAKDNYIQARDCQGDGTEEVWLTHYMLGKIAEKQHEAPGVYLEHYKQAAICLYNEEAVYPKKIIFTNIPPPLALEALEVFYRLHVSALKVVLYSTSSEHLQLVLNYVRESLQSPFAKCEEKCKKVDQDSREEPSLSQTFIYHKNPLDHEYSKHNSANSIQPDEKLTSIQQVTSSQQLSSSQQVTSSQQLMSSQQVTSSQHVTSSQQVTPSQKLTSSEQVTSSEHVASSEQVTTSQLVTSIQQLTSSQELMSNQLPTSSQQLMSGLPLISSQPAKVLELNDTKFSETMGSDSLPEKMIVSLGLDLDKLSQVEPAVSSQVDTVYEYNVEKSIMHNISNDEVSSKNMTKYLTETTISLADSKKESIDLQASKDTCDVMDTGEKSHTDSIMFTDGQLDKQQDQNDMTGCNSSQLSIASNQSNSQSIINVLLNDMKETRTDTINSEGDASGIKSVSLAQNLTSPSASLEGPGDQNATSETPVTSMAPLMPIHNMNGAGDTKVGERKMIPLTEREMITDNVELRNEESKKSVDIAHVPATITTLAGVCNSSEVVAGNSSVDSAQEICAETKSLESVCYRDVSENLAILLDHSKGLEAVKKPEDAELTLKAEIITKCIKGLQLCAERYSAHYKSLYRLADIYCFSKDFNKARDILLGRSDWQDQSHMPAPGLFAERKQSNFFQGLWKIPIEDIDRSGCFASHVHRSVVLLLKVLTELGDLDMLKTVRTQLKRTPDTGKKFLRDAERLALAEEAFLKCVEVVQRVMAASDKWSESQREDNLATVYQVWLLGKGSIYSKKATVELHKAFKIMMKGRTDINRLTEDQALSYCQSNLSKVAPSPATIAPQGKLTAEKSKPTQSTPTASLENDKKELPTTKVKIKDDEMEASIDMNVSMPTKTDNLVESNKSSNENSKSDSDKIMPEDVRDANINSSLVTDKSDDSVNVTETFKFTLLKTLPHAYRRQAENSAMALKSFPEAKANENQSGSNKVNNPDTLITNTNQTIDLTLDREDNCVTTSNVDSNSKGHQPTQKSDDEDDDDVIVISESD